MKVTLTSTIILLASVLACTDAWVNHGGSCDNSSSVTDCDPSQDTACIDGLCQCVQPGDMEFNEDRGICEALVGRNCRREDTTYYTYSCVTNAYCAYNSRVCICNYQYSEAANGHCMGTHGLSCNSTVTCNPADLLTCELGRCRCPNPMNDVWKSERHRCFRRVGSACSPNTGPGQITCDPEATQCLADATSPTGYSCKCKAGLHLEHYARQCVRGFNTECSNGTDNLHPPCDTVAGLRCKDGVCQCELSPDQAWDPATKACASLEGRGCNLETGPNPWYDDEYFFHCYTGLECVPFENHQFEGICRRPATG